MSVIFVLLPAALAFAAVALGVFVWAARSGQFDDLHTPSLRILHDDLPVPPSGDDPPRRAR
jgi:cbb3-type cytochrome oxidase maturation protein